MFLFHEKDEIEISITCKLCMEKITFIVTADEYQKIMKFPFEKESIHGTPKHRLVVYIDKNLEIENFSIQDAFEDKVSYSEELTRQVLSDIQLTDEEIQLYFSSTGRDAISTGEMALLIDRSKEECAQIAKKFVELGLYKEIVGASPHYVALPPYAALLRQLETFHEYITAIKTNAPEQLNQSFAQLEAQTAGISQLNEYTEFMRNLKENVLSQMDAQKEEVNNAIEVIDQIREINNVINRLPEDTKGIIDDQMEEIGQQFEEIKSLISDNLQRLHLGVLKKTVNQIIENVLSSRLEVIVENFNKQFLGKIKKIIEDVAVNINSITQSSMNTGENIKTIFSNVNEEFSKAVIDSEEKLKGISDNVFNSFGELRDTFSTKVIDTLNQELLSILKRLEISEVTTQEFWDQARKKTLMTMKDLWFVRSIEGAKAHISEEILKAKMRILIVAPEITDINPTLLQQIPRHVNVRIATHIDLSNPEHESILQMFDGMHNVAYRHREMKNLFGINRDYEEVILCVVSQAELAGQLITEIGGIGSITPEHIKIFTPVLEEAWIGARKEVMTGVRPSFAQRAVPDPSLQPQINEPSIVPETQIPSPESPATPDYLQQYRNTSPPETSETPVNQPYQDSPSNNYQQNEFIPEPSHEIDIPAPMDPTPNYSQPSTPTITTSVDVSTLGGQYENIINNLGNWTGIEISKNLGEFHNNYVENRGYNSVLKQIQMTIGTLQLQSHILSQGEIAQIKKKLVFWKKKLNV